MGAFDRYAPFVQDFIYRNDWESLRGIQVAAADAIFNTDQNVLLTSSTASGKTEAAFFPIITLLSEDPPASVGALYIGPLKALINDQFHRLVDLCEEGGIAVWHWHGDVAASHKQRMMKKPSGILQITPESLEAFLLHKHAAVAKTFCDLRFVVIDEVHAMLRGDRGLQTFCLIERLSRLSGANPRRIGLSATIGDHDAAAALLSAGSGRGTVVPKVEEKGATWRLSMEHFFTTGVQAGDYSKSGFAEPDAPLQVESVVTDPGGGDPSSASGDGYGPSGGQYVPTNAEEDAVKSFDAPDCLRSLGLRDSKPADGAAADGRVALAPPDGTPMPEGDDGSYELAPANADPGMAYIFDHTRGRKCLVFSNSREECEAVTTTLRSYCERAGEPDRFLIHHGNLSQSFRETAEDLMRDEDLFMTTCTTATLELGIDIGRLERAFQIDAPFTVSAFLQRMGRTGRRGQPPEMRFIMREDQPEPRAMLPESIPWKLIQGAALVQLYIEEKWVEPPMPGKLPYSLLYHQTMATLASGGEMTPASLAGRILTLSPFNDVSQDDFRTLLRHLLSTDHIEQTERGGLIVGLEGERVVNNFRFYGVFVESEEYTVRSDSQELGTLVAPPPPGEKIAIAGSVWIVESVDHKRRLVYCTEVKGKVPAYFGECPGDIHTHILERMKRVLEEDAYYPYLQQNARARLSEARAMARAAGAMDGPLVNLGGDTWALFPWLGTYSFLALERVMKLKLAGRLGIKGMDSSRPYYIQFRMGAAAEDLIGALADVMEEGFDPLDLVFPDEVPVFDKYDEYLPPALVRKGFAEGVLDLENLSRRIREWLPEKRMRG